MLTAYLDWHEIIIDKKKFINCLLAVGRLTKNHLEHEVQLVVARQNHQACRVYCIRLIRRRSRLVATPPEVLNEIVAVPRLLLEKHAARGLVLDGRYKKSNEQSSRTSSNLSAKAPESPSSVMSVDCFSKDCLSGSYWCVNKRRSQIVATLE